MVNILSMCLVFTAYVLSMIIIGIDILMKFIKKFKYAMILAKNSHKIVFSILIIYKSRIELLIYDCYNVK